jgi:hypothetical protein
MKRFDAERNAGTLGVREHFAEAVEEGGAGVGEGLAVGRA